MSCTIVINKPSNNLEVMLLIHDLNSNVQSNEDRLKSLVLQKNNR